MAKPSEFDYDVLHCTFPNSPKAYAYKYTAAYLYKLGHKDATVKAGDAVVVRTKDGLQVVEVARVLGRDNETRATMEKATSWIVDLVDTKPWEQVVAAERKAKQEAAELAAMLDELL